MMDGWTERGRDGLAADDRVLGGLIAAIVCAVRNLFPRVGRGGAPEEIVGAVLYLASDAASYTTGAHLQVDRGYVPVR